MKRKTKNTFVTMYNEKKRFKITGKGWVVQRIKQPTMNKGSQILWSKRFPTKQKALEYYDKFSQR